MNYNSSTVGVPFVRVSQIVINYPQGGTLPSATINQELDVLLADGTTRTLQPMGSLNASFDMVAHGADPIPLVDLTTGAPTGGTTTLMAVLLGILAVVRQQQNAVQ
jgi:hypothetical protein